jgi:hypothetical protein
MKMPTKLRDQLAFYDKAGFSYKSVEPRKGSHWLVVFEKVGPMVVTTNVGDPRSLKNNLSELRRRERLAAEGLAHVGRDGGSRSLSQAAMH